MTTPQLLAILHKCRELRVADVDAWPRFLFGKKLDEMSQAEAAKVVLHLDLQDALDGERR